MKLKCKKCGYEDAKVEFRFIRMAEPIGPNTYRRCPVCQTEVYCEEIEDLEDYTGTGVWGAGRLRGQVFKKATHKKPEVKTENDGGESGN